MNDLTPITLTAPQRLDALPPKTAQPFRELLNIGQLSEETVQTVLDAGFLSGQAAKLIGFTAGYLHMRSIGVPVHDTIQMAKTHKRRINLGWSPARWKDEHDKLSRLEALQRLAQENVTYDVSAYAKHLPERFSGYLIRSSRKLGMEGLRQRHCVANYHDKLKAGSCAIAAIFVDHQRWTTELHLTGNEDAPLRITQIKTRHNQLPPAHVRKQIHDMLGIELKTSAAAAPAPDTPVSYLYMENLRAILPTLQAHGITAVSVYFDGSGDEGSIQNIHLQPGDSEETVLALPAQIRQSARFLDGDRWVTQTAPNDTTIEEAIETITYDFLEETGVDWYNNDGGFGELVINVTAGTVSIDVSTRFTESTTAYSAERDIATGDQL